MPRIRIGRGPLDTERLLLEEVSLQLDELGEEILSRPILIVVPSLSLRVHLLSRLAAHLGRGVAGIACRTLHGLAAELVDRAGGEPPRGIDLFPLFGRRRAQREPTFRRSLEHLRDGYGAVLGSVRDLLDAGLDPAHAEALDEALADEGRRVASRVEVDRARALVRVAVGTLEALEATGAGRTSTLLRQAAELVVVHPEELLESGALLVHGFADATGVTTDLLQALLQVYGGILFLDHPPDPARPGAQEVDVPFTRRLAERLQAVARLEVGADTQGSAPRIALFRALGAEAEVREAAHRMRQLLDAGVRAEAIGLVARSLEPYRRPVRRHLHRLGVPFSSFDNAGPLGPGGRRIRALLDLLAEARRAPVDRWLDAAAQLFEGTQLHDLRLALFSLGAGRLGEAAELEFEDFLDGDHYPLPVRLGFSDPDAQSDDPDPDRDPVRLRRRRLAGDVLRKAVHAASRTCRELERWQKALPASSHLAAARRLILDDLAWQPDEEVTRTVLSELEFMGQALPADLSLDFEEFTRLLRDRLRPLGRVDLGGRGAGVQILEVTEARGRTFEHLFVLGLNRGVFPRAVREDPLFPDSLRRVIGREGHGVLPDLPRKLAGFDEERYLFAQLLASSPQVTLSWQVVDDDNAALTPSPLLARLSWSAADGDGLGPMETPVARDLLALPDFGGEAAGDLWPATASESAVLVALHGGRQRLAQVLPLALAEAGEPVRGPATDADQATDLHQIAQARLRILDEMDPATDSRNGDAGREALGPYFGFVGESRGSDPRERQPLYVTTLERLSRCPWRTFLEKVLRIEGLPDPLEILPGVDPLMMGDLVHRVLEAIVRERLPDSVEDLTEARQTRAVRVPWPPDEALRSIIHHHAKRVVRARGLGLPGLDDILAEMALPHLEAARELEWSDDGTVPVLAAEWEGELLVKDDRGDERSLRFRADRVDRLPEGLRLSDYKTGRRVISSSTNPRIRRQKLLQAVGSGEWLQSVAYALATGEASDSGRYLFLNPTLPVDPEIRSVTARADDAELVTAFERAVGILVGAWRSGHFFPRLVEPDRDREPPLCTGCSLAEACLRGDSSSRSRLREWADRAVERYLQGPSDLPPAERNLTTTWLLPSKRQITEGAGEEGGS